MRAAKYDVVVIGAGIIGLSTAMNLLERFPHIKLAILEKNAKEGMQQSGHNSGVIHSGIYYKPGSFKAQFCVTGRASMTQFCEENGIPVWTCGKLMVANDDAGVERLNALEERGPPIKSLASGCWAAMRSSKSSHMLPLVKRCTRRELASSTNAMSQLPTPGV